MQLIKILIVEDDVTSQLMLKTMLDKYQLTVVGSGEEGVMAASEAFDLVILDINLPGIDGYQTCRQLRGEGPNMGTPVIFLSAYSELEDRLEAFDAGGNDYISKPFDVRELQTKVARYAELAEAHKRAGSELDSSRHLLMDVQTTASKLQSISRFIQSTLFCHDLDALVDHFFRTANEIGLEGVLLIEADADAIMRSSDGEVTKLEHEILEMASQSDERIRRFGNDRAIFHWGHATFVTRKVGDLIDTLAMFMDALEAGIKAVDTEYKLIQQVELVESQNVEIRSRVADLMNMMSGDLKLAILSLGLVSALDVDDEDRLNDLIEGFLEKIDHELKTMADNNGIMQQLITELRTPPPELQSLMEGKSEPDDGIMLF